MRLFFFIFFFVVAFTNAKDSLSVSGSMHFGLYSQPKIRSNSFNDTAEVYRHNWRALYASPETWYEAQKAPSLLGSDIQLSFGDFSFFGRYELVKDLEAWYQSKSGHNLISGFSDLNMNIPQKVFLQWQGETQSLQLGRFTHKMGKAKYGVLLSNPSPLDGGLYKFKLGYLEYQLLAAGMEPWLLNNSDLYFDEPTLQNRDTVGNQRGRIYTEPYKTLFIHRMNLSFEFIEFGLSEFTTIAGVAPGIRDFLPMMIWHNLYSSGYANGGGAAHFSLSLPKLFDFYGELVFDEINAGEVAAEDSNDSPTTQAFVLGLSRKDSLFGGTLSSRLEYVSVDKLFGSFQLPLGSFNNRLFWRSNYRDRFQSNYADIQVIPLPIGYYRGSDLKDLWLEFEWSKSNYDAFLQFGWLETGSTQYSWNYDQILIHKSNYKSEYRIHSLHKYLWLDQYSIQLGFTALTGDLKFRAIPQGGIAYIYDF